MKLRRFFPAALVWCVCLGATDALAEPMKLAIRADFPGGNVLVQSNEGSTAHLAPDLRDSNPWFYWYFEATASQPGRATFVFAKPPEIGVRGPAVSVDGGRSWRWLGRDHVQYAVPIDQTAATQPTKPKQDSFSYDFTQPNQSVRFAVAIPYVQSDLDAFLNKNANNPHLHRSVLTKTRHGLPVDLLQIGQPGPDVQAVLMTARHHACESMASYVLEGLLQEALGDSPAAVAFRKKYVLYCVPIVDKDGVQAGDQGKGRRPHDHNRDYGEEHLYPEVKAIQALAADKQVRLAVDFHCPFLRGDVHEAFYWDGIRIPHVVDNITELTHWLGEERPPEVMVPINFMKKPPAKRPVNGMPFSFYFAYLEHSLLGVTLEVPFTQPNVPLDAAMARAYGASVLKVWVRTDFVASDDSPSRGTAGYDAFEAFQKQFKSLYMAKPQEAETLADTYLKDAGASSLYRAEADNLMATMRLRQRRFAEALDYCKAALAEGDATTRQKTEALQRQVLIAAADPQSTPQAVEAFVAQWEQFPYLAPGQQVQTYRAVSDYYEKKKDAPKALAYARKCLPPALPREKGGVLNRIADLLDQLHKPQEAIAARQQAVALLRPQLMPPRTTGGIFYGMMAGDLFDALNGIPTATMAEKREAATLILNYQTTPPGLKEKVQAWLKANGASQ